MPTRHSRPSRHAFTLTEMLVTIAVIGVLLGLLFPVLEGFRKSSLMTKSMTHLRQVAGWLALYAGDNRDFVIPSQFDYDPQRNPENSYPGKVRSEVTNVALLNKKHAGTWADIIWSEYKLGVFPEALPGMPVGFGQDYRYDSPDGLFYGQRVFNDQPGLNLEADNPLRSAAPNSRNTYSDHDIATPYGAGAGEKGLPGYFAANNFFNTDPNAQDARTPSRPIDAGWYTQNQVRMPERSMYLVDSFAGEVIQPWPERYKLPPDADQSSGNQDGDATPQIKPENQVDFRYSDLCLMLFLDGHSETQAKWAGIEQLEGYANNPAEYDPANRRIRIRELDKRISTIAN